MQALDLKNWKNLSHRLGFSAQLNLHTGKIVFQEIKPRLSLKRKARDIKMVWSSPLTKEFSNKTVHWIYRCVGDSLLWQKENLKLDITVIMPGTWRGEYIKTTGHYHLPLTGKHIASLDFYQLIYGKGVILIHREDDQKTAPYIIYPKIMQPVFIPPEYAHCTINIGDEPVVFQNICTRDPHLNYDPILERGGMAYFLMKENGRIRFVLNPRYLKTGHRVEKIGRVSIMLRRKFLEKCQPFYTLFQCNATNLRFLNKTHRQTYIMRRETM